MRPTSEYPMPAKVDDKFANEIFYEAGFKNQEAIPEYAWAAVKLAYRLGYNRCANLEFR